jgi:hypothetical protein
LLGEAVEGEAPTIWRKDWTAMIAYCEGIESLGLGLDVCGYMYRLLAI